MAIIQPENKTLVAVNNTGIPLNLEDAGDIVRGNASQPSNGRYTYTFVTNDKVVVRERTFTSSPVSVITDGSTYNNNIGGRGIDIVFKTGRSRGDQVKVSVFDTVEGKDTHIRDLSGQNLNHGSSQATEVGVGLSLNKSRGLIKFDVSVLGFISLKVIDSVVMLWVHAAATPLGDIFVMHEISFANTDWVEGTVNGSQQTGSSSWNNKQHGILPWAGSAGLSTVGVDFNSAVLSSLPILDDRNLWVFFRSNGERLNRVILSWMKKSVFNSGILIKHIDELTNERLFRFRPADYTADITLRPKIIILFAGIDTEDGGSPEGFGGGPGGLGGLGGPGDVGDRLPGLATSMGSETTFGGA